MVERALEQLKKDNAAKEEQRGNGDSKPKEREEETNGGVTGSPEDNGGVSKERNSLPEPMDRSSFPPCAPTGGQHQTEASAVSKEEEDNDDEERGSGPPPATSQESLTEDTQQQASRGSTTAPTQQQQQQPPSTSWKVRTLQKAETLRKEVMGLFRTKKARTHQVMLLKFAPGQAKFPGQPSNHSVRRHKK
ncbi:uncharacterized protein LOC119176423 [Rhipicephalus microplus]|uniref:uncharacterized protein LOC119176423 n=1 Tax=Rhipicephalus microplus TaxID=6941 RepID=UPI001887499B|nr:uncharacterized protein LOC119176423 [Rhipicephalus microplus]